MKLKELNVPVSESDIDLILGDADLNADKKLSYVEFVTSVLSFRSFPRAGRLNSPSVCSIRLTHSC